MEKLTEEKLDKMKEQGFEKVIVSRNNPYSNFFIVDEVEIEIDKNIDGEVMDQEYFQKIYGVNFSDYEFFQNCDEEVFHQSQSYRLERNLTIEMIEQSWELEFDRDYYQAQKFAYYNNGFQEVLDYHNFIEKYENIDIDDKENSYENGTCVFDNCAFNMHINKDLNKNENRILVFVH